MNPNKHFPCTLCGICCKHIELCDGMTYASFPYKHVNGRCEKLGTDNKCMVYDSRPSICNIAKQTENMNNTEKANYFNMNKDACNKLQELFKVPLKYRVK